MGNFESEQQQISTGLTESYSKEEKYSGDSPNRRSTLGTSQNSSLPGRICLK